MKITVSGKNMDVTDALKDYAVKRISKIDKYFDNDIEAQVTMNVEKDRHIVEVTIPINGIILRGEEETADMYSSIDLVVEKLERQIHKYKTKINRKLRKTAFKFNNKNMIEDVKNEEPKVVKTKRFAIKPMTIEEAILQMNLLDHDFFVFFNAETEEANVLYKRKDGNYGLIEPEF
ncbi:MAG: putative sigma-54 modulation protein [Thermosediminibacterales bacterium]|nr:putative sigma-54 modulation protein [Thermosediminibacterales bacterium]MDK2836199.1 putative sigma-54 modulation protein [Thermosediminibacterales bacterium]